MLQAQRDQRRFQLLRVTPSDRVDQYQRRRVRRGLSEFRRGTQRSQILYGMVGTCQSRMTRQIRKRAIEFAAVRASALLRAAAAEHVQTRGPGRRARPQMRGSQCRDGRDCGYRREYSRGADCKET